MTSTPTSIPPTLFCTLDSAGIARLIRTAKRAVCYAGPGIQREPADAMIAVAQKLGTPMITLCIDFDERVMRMGFGDIEAVRTLQKVGIVVQHTPGLRTALVIVDDQGFIFTPTALYLEAEPPNTAAANAMRLSSQQVAEALARLSPAAKAIAQAQATTQKERDRIAAIPVEVNTAPITNTQFNRVDTNLKEAPPVKFDIARQVRVFESYLQYVELSLTGAAIQRHRLTIPPAIQKLGGSKEIEDRLRTTFELIDKDSKLSSKPLEEELNEIRENLTRSLGKTHGRVVLKKAKPLLMQRIEALKKKLEIHRQKVQKGLQQHLDKSRKQIVDYYLPIVTKNPPDALVGQLWGKPTKDDVRIWLNDQLNQVFPSPESLIEKMELEIRFKDMTFETLNRPDFFKSVKEAFKNVDWDKTYKEFLAAGEAKT